MPIESLFMPGMRPQQNLAAQGSRDDEKKVLSGLLQMPVYIGKRQNAVGRGTDME